MRFDIYHRLRIDVQRNGDGWMVYDVSNGMRVPRTDLVIPAHVPESELETWLDDQFHELARPGQRVRRID